MPICDRKDGEDGKPCKNAGLYIPGLRIWACEAKDHPPAVIHIPLRVCEAHSKDLCIDDILTEDGWDYFTAKLLREWTRPPMRETAELFLETIS